LTTTPQNPLLIEITALEHRVWDALVTGDAVADAALVSSTFLGVYPDGFAGKSDHTGQLENGPTVKHYALDRFHFRVLGTDHAMLSYRAEFQRITRAIPEIMYVTSVWEHGPQGWTNVFSQDTPA
jgi:hypothetical protein